MLLSVMVTRHGTEWRPIVGEEQKASMRFLICVFACVVVICMTIAYIQTIKKPDEPRPLRPMKIWEKERGD